MPLALADSQRAQNGPSYIGPQNTRSSQTNEAMADEEVSNGVPSDGGKCDTAEDRGQESDGEFFEHFTALSWKQENRRLQASRQCDDLPQEPSKEPSLHIPHRDYHIGKKEWEELYVEVLYTVEHKLGADGAFAEDLRAYAQQAFGMPEETHERLLAAARREQPPIPVLNVTVLEARGLEAKDPNGFSDPYCMLGIHPGSLRRSSAEDDVRSGGSLRRLGANLKRRGVDPRSRGGSLPDILPAKFIRTTTVKPSTLNPRWNERFRLDIDDIRTDCLHLDVWDHDDESSVFDAARKLNEVSGLKGLNRYFKQVAQSARASSEDDFLGCIDVPLEEVPPAGLERWFPLCGRTHRSSVQGQIKLRLTLGTREDRGLQPPQDNWKEVVEHQQLLWIFLEHELAHWQGPSESWTGEFQYAAKAILDQHALQGDLTELQKAICRWVTFSRKHIATSLDHCLLLDLLQNLDRAWSDADRPLTRDEQVVSGVGEEAPDPRAGEPTEKEQLDQRGHDQQVYGPERQRDSLVSSAEEACLAESFGIFVDYCLEVLHRHREARSKLTHLLQCLSLLHRMKSFQRCCPFRNQLSVDVAGALKKAAADWIQSVPLDPSGEVVYDMSSLSALVNSLCRELQQGHLLHDAAFQEYVGVSYTAVMYRQLEKLAGTKLQHWVQTLCGAVNENSLPESEAMDHAVKVFELYMALKEFVGFREYLSEEEREHLSMADFHQWFFHAVEGWFTVARSKARQRIRSALELDQLKFVDSYVQHSTSAVDTVTCFGQIKQFWKQLAWPDLEACYPFILKIVEAICDGAVYYATLCHQKLLDSGFYDTEGQFDIAMQVCAVLNNMEHVRRALRPLRDELEVEELLGALERERGEAVAYRCRESLSRLLQSAEDDVIHKILTVVAALSEKMRPEIKKFVFHLAWAPEKLDANSGLDPLVEYLEENLKTLYESLTSVNFFRTLEAVWRVVLQELTLTTRSNLGERLPFFRRLYAALEVLLNFFHGEDKGLSLKSLHSVAYQDLERLLRLHKADTSYLIETYCLQRLEEQHKQEQQPGQNPNGYLTVFLCYNQVAERLRVDVVRARDLRPLDPNGFSDPFVILELLPKHLFPDCPQQKTKVQKKTLAPFFDESFEFVASAERCRQEAALLRLTVMDYDVMLRDDFEGEVFVPLSSLPGLRAGEEDEEEMPRPLDLPLLLLNKEKNEVLCALEFRTWDRDAQEFVRQQKRRRP